MWWPFRTRIGAPTKHDAPKDFNVHQGMVEEFELPWITKMKHAGTIKVAPHEFPFAIITLKFPEPPAILVGRDPAAYVDWEVWTRYSEEEVKKYLGQDKKSIHLAPVEPDTFLRFLAKMAHGYAVGELGEKTFDPTLTHFIRNMPLRALEWIGGQKNDPPATESLHDIQWEIQTVEQINYVVVNLRLFSCFGTPPYRIVVGKIRCPLDSLPLIKQPLYTIDIKRTMPFREQNADHQ